MAQSGAYGDRPEGGRGSVRGVPRLVRWLGALTSVLLIGGLGYFVYDLATRDTRAVPVVRALEGPTREQPEVPGGFEAAHQGLAVNRIASDGDAAPLSERVVLAPEAAGVTDEDQPATQMQAEAAPVEPVDPDAALRSAVDGALSEILGGLGLAPGDDAAEDTSNRPKARPGDAQVAAVAPAPAASATGASVQVMDPALIPPGTRLVQLGAFDEEDEAQAEWARLSTQFDDYMVGKKRVIERAEVGDRVFYRLRVYGFDGLSEARNFCSVLMADRVDCIPVLTR